MAQFLLDLETADYFVFFIAVSVVFNAMYGVVYAIQTNLSIYDEWDFLTVNGPSFSIVFQMIPAVIGCLSVVVNLFEETDFVGLSLLLLFSGFIGFYTTYLTISLVRLILGKESALPEE